MRQRFRLLRLAVTLTCLALGLTFAGLSLGLIPDSTRATVVGRKGIAEAIGVHCAAEVERGNEAELQAVLTEAIARNPELRSIAVRRLDGIIVASAGEEASNWQGSRTERFDGANATLAISLDNLPWGQLELSFEPLPVGPFGSPPETWFILFVGIGGLCAFGAYVWYLARRAASMDLVPQRVRAALDSLVEGVVVLDAQERIVLANTAFTHFAKLSQDQLVGKSVSDLPWAPPAGGLLLPTDLPWVRSRKKGTPQCGTVLRLDAGDDSRRLSINTTPILSDDAQNCGTLATFHDLTPVERANNELKAALQKLQNSRAEIHRQNQDLKVLATRDPLTLCLNRRSFMAELNSLWDQSQRSGQAISCVMVDVDHFKNINDTYGHTTGDVVLQKLAEVLRNTSRNTDLVCRYGGEEFCLLLPQAGAVAAEVQAERIRKALAAEPLGGVSVTASLGLSSTEFRPESIQTFLDQADKALYAAKHGGRNQVIRFDRIVSANADPSIKPSTSRAPIPRLSTVPYPAVTALLSALAYRDPQTAAHSRRVADLCVRTGEGWLSQADCHIVEIAALLHDVGKLGVPDNILFKPEQLTADELAYVRAFDDTGVEIVTAAFASPELTRIVSQRQLWFAGFETGRPGGPVGDSIPIAARLLAAADAFDAMVNDQPYRSGMTYSEALKELRRESGTRFDPEVVERIACVVLAEQTAHGSVERTLPGEAALAIGGYIEQLVSAIQRKDVTGLGVVAGELRDLVVKHRANHFVARITVLDRAVCEGADWSVLGPLANEVLSFCRASRKAYLRDCKAMRPVMGNSSPVIELGAVRAERSPSSDSSPSLHSAQAPISRM